MLLLLMLFPTSRSCRVDNNTHSWPHAFDLDDFLSRFQLIQVNLVSNRRSSSDWLVWNLATMIELSIKSSIAFDLEISLVITVGEWLLISNGSHREFFDLLFEFWWHSSVFNAYWHVAIDMSSFSTSISTNYKEWLNCCLLHEPDDLPRNFEGESLYEVIKPRSELKGNDTISSGRCVPAMTFNNEFNLHQWWKRSFIRSIKHKFHPCFH